ncbi:hypothetical protein DID88_005299 [Monilinia fructigena]|uniref:Uncharacterized protein n=1 Tax=Monilinia fructigena TaxID=38457 RepID=A0A395IZD4_9HELO|nr:hypothetical protein DID88_005299 [Monilinia fructigena]
MRKDGKANVGSRRLYFPRPSLGLGYIQYFEWTDEYLTEGPVEKYSIGEPISDEQLTNLSFEKKISPSKIPEATRESFSLDNHGFIVRNFGKGAASLAEHEELGDATIQKSYLPLIEGLLKAEVEGANRVFPFDWRVRNAELRISGRLTSSCTHY